MDNKYYHVLESDKAIPANKLFSMLVEHADKDTLILLHDTEHVGEYKLLKTFRYDPERNEIYLSDV